MLTMKKLRSFTKFIRNLEFISLFGVIFFPWVCMTSALVLNEIHTLGFLFSHKNKEDIFNKLKYFAIAEVSIIVLSLLLLSYSLVAGICTVGIGIILSDLSRILFVFPQRIRPESQNAENRHTFLGRCLLKGAVMFQALAMFSVIHWFFYLAAFLFLISSLELIVRPCFKYGSDMLDENALMDNTLAPFVPNQNTYTLDDIVEPSPHDEDDNLFPESCLATPRKWCQSCFGASSEMKRMPIAGEENREHWTSLCFRGDDEPPLHRRGGSSPVPFSSSDEPVTYHF